MLLALILLSTVFIAQTVYFIYYKNQIKDIGNQLSFISKHHSFKFVQVQIRPREIEQLVQICNVLLSNQRQLNEQFIQKNEEINATIVSLSHDIRTPLTSLGGYLQLAETETDLPEISRYITLAQTRMKQMANLVDELFFYTKLQNPEYIVEVAPIDLIAVLQKRLISMIDEFTRHHHEPELYLPDCPIYIEGNSSVLERVFDNILRNYFLHGSGALTIKYNEMSDEAVLQFTNSLKPDHRIQTDKLFSRFYKEDPSRTLHSSGLGLSIVKSLMEKMNGITEVSLDDGQFQISIAFMKSVKEKEHD